MCDGLGVVVSFVFRDVHHLEPNTHESASSRANATSTRTHSIHGSERRTGVVRDLVGEIYPTPLALFMANDLSSDLFARFVILLLCVVRLGDPFKEEDQGVDRL
jgi:hypothetical protein